MYEAIRALEQVGVLSWVNRPPACSATRCNDVARSRVAGSVSIRLDPGAVRGLSGECGQGQIKPREPQRPSTRCNDVARIGQFRRVTPGR